MPKSFLLKLSVNLTLRNTYIDNKFTDSRFPESFTDSQKINLNNLFSRFTIRIMLNAITVDNC